MMISSGFVVPSVEFNWPISALRSALSSPLLDTILVENVTSSTGDAGCPIIDNSGALRGEDGGGVTMPGRRLFFSWRSGFEMKGDKKEPRLRKQQL